MAGITREQLELQRPASSLTGWSTTTNNLYGALDAGLNQEYRGLAGSLDSVIAANNRYLQSGNIGKDIQYYYDNYGNNADFYTFLNLYNGNIDTLNNSWKTNPLHYNAKGWQPHNQLYKKMYNSRSVIGGDIGYSNKLEDLLGSSTWLRNADHYDTSWYTLNDAQKAERTHTITINGKQYKVGKDQYGHLVEIPDTPTQDNGNPSTPIVNKNNILMQWTDWDITKYKEPEKPIFDWTDWILHTNNLIGDLGTAASNYHNNTLLKTPLLLGYGRIHKDTSNYFLRATLENNNNKMLSQAALVASSISDPTLREAVLQQAHEDSLQNTLAQNQEFSKANLLNIEGATNVANFNKEKLNTIANSNMQSISAAHNDLIQNRNEFNTAKNAAIKDAATKTYESYKKAVKGHRLNLLNIDIETAKFNNLVDLTNLQKKYKADLFNSTYNKDNILKQLKHIVGPIGVNGGTTVRDQYYSEDLNQLDMEHLTEAINHLEYGEPLTTQDKAIIDKVIGIENDYNQKLFSNLSNIKADLKNKYDTDKLNLQLGLQDYLRRLNILISDQGFNPWRYKKGGKVDTSIINNAFKNFQKEQESARKNSVEDAKLRLSKLEKALDRIHEKLIFLLKQIYK